MKGVPKRLRQEVMVLSIDAETGSKFVPTAHAHQEQVMGIVAFFDEVAVDKRRHKGKAQFLGHLARHHCLMNVAQSSRNGVGLVFLLTRSPFAIATLYQVTLIGIASAPYFVATSAL